jgi:two-component system cell cycle response regulator CtrA
MRLLVIAKSGVLALNLAADMNGSVVTEAASVAEAAAMLQSETYDLVVLDVTMPAGLDLVRHLRASQNDVPILAMTGTKARDRRIALALGADDAVPSPVDPDELSARIACVVRRRRNGTSSQLTIANVTLCADRRDAFVAGVPVTLTGREYAIVECLALAKGRAVSKDGLLAFLYGDVGAPEAKIIDVFICKTRRKLHQAGADALIATVWGLGYAINDHQGDKRYSIDDRDHQLVA